MSRELSHRKTVWVQCENPRCGIWFEKDEWAVANTNHNFHSLPCFHEWYRGENHPLWEVRGENSLSWQGGRCIDGEGYVLIKYPEHPHAKLNGYVFEHRLIMEQHLGRYLEPSERVHHANGDRADNRPENLMLFASNSEHKQYHDVLRAASAA